jgi:redox-sensitive bicupin YhaK (pirin superfamily)
MGNGKIISVQKLGFPWQTEDPFLATMYHEDDYPAGNAEQGVDREQLAGRNIGGDFELRDGFRMYHGQTVPGFPAHPHKGFETVTIVLQGHVDHFDSQGAVGRYGGGDVQWLTTGSGCQHTEMFPLVHSDKPNPLELFQIWLNLPAKSKSAQPDYKMLWAEDIPVIEAADGGKTTVKVIAGRLNGVQSLEPTGASWASRTENHVGIFLIRMEPGATFTLPAVSGTLNRNVYFYQGESMEVGGEKVSVSHRVKLAGDEEVELTNGSQESFLLVLEGEPINEPVAQYGPFVMNTRAEIQAAFADFQRTQFGGWPWGRPDPVNERDAGRFARYGDGRMERRGNERG